MNSLKARLWYQIGLIHRIRGLWGRGRKAFLSAERAFTRALELDEHYLNAKLARGSLYWRELASPDRAIDDFSAVLEQSSENAEALFMRGLAHQAAGNYQSAITDLEAFLKLEPDSMQAGTALRQIKVLSDIMDDLPKLPS